MDERFWARFPRVYALVADCALYLSPRSRARQWLIRRQFIQGWAAVNRGDYQSMRSRYEDTIDYVWEPDLVALGMPERITGFEEWMRAVAEFNQVWARWDYRVHYVVDLGRTMVSLGRCSMWGVASGAEAVYDYSQVIDLPRGRVARQRDVIHWDRALALAGLDPALLDRLVALPPGGTLEL